MGIYYILRTVVKCHRIFRLLYSLRSAPPFSSESIEVRTRIRQKVESLPPRDPPPKPIHVFGRSSCRSAHLEWFARRGETTPEVLCISLLMSPVATFIAIFGKQWLSHYPRYTGGSVVERCGDRLCKCGGLEKWKSHSFIEFPHHTLDCSPSHLWAVSVNVVD